MKIKRIQRFSFDALPEKEIKSLAALELIRKKGSISRKDIAENTGIKIVSVSHYVKDYIKEGLILEGGIDVSTGGRKPELFELNTVENYVVGMEISQDLIRVILMDIGLASPDGIKAERRYSAGEDISQICQDTTRELIKKSNVPTEKIRALGIGLSDSAAESFLSGLESKIGLKIYYSDLPTCAAFAERYLNPEASVENMLYIYSDLGTGVILKGENLRPVSEDEAAYLKPWHKSLGISEMAKKEVAKGVGTGIVTLAEGKIEHITDDIVIEAARQNDEVASNIVYSAGINVGTRTAYLANLFGPQSVVLGGGLEEAADLILDPIKKVMDKLALKSRMSALNIVAGKLRQDAVSMGAAALAVRETFLRA